jgi:alanine racemase
MQYRKNERVVDLDAIRNNVRVLQGAVGPNVKVMAVVKADAYGHGMCQTARAAISAGASFLGVATPDEGAALREAGITAPILVFGALTREAAQATVEFELTQTVCRAEMIYWLQAECQKANREAYVHLKVDTGMNRIGVKDESEAQKVLDALHECPQVRLTGTYTHFADADGMDEGFTHQQFVAFEKIGGLLPQNILRHAANSAATLRFPQMHFNMVRPGIALYGCPPVKTSLPLRPAMRWITEVVHVKEVQPGDTVSYGRTFTASKPMRVATVSVGYGDGYHRMLSNRGKVLVDGQFAPILGRVCMDQTMVDVTEIPGAAPGSEAVLLGRQGGNIITADEMGQWAGTISYEVLLAPTTRVPRRFEHVDG